MVEKKPEKTRNTEEKMLVARNFSRIFKLSILRINTNRTPQ